MGIVLVYRSSRVINFAVGDLGVPSAALLGVDGRQAPLAVLARARSPPSLVGTLAGAVVELAVIRRLFTRAARDRARRHDRRRAARAGGHPRAARLPHRHAPDRVPDPDHRRVAPGVGHHGHGAAAARADRRAAHHDRRCGGCSATPRFGEAVRASVSNPDLARLTGINPKLVSTAVWTIAGFLSADRGDPHRHRVDVHRPRVDRAEHAAARAGGRAGRAHGLVPQGGHRRGGDRRRRPGAVLQLHERDRARAVRAVPRRARARGAREPRPPTPGAESFQFAPACPRVPERLREIWWVRRLPQLRRRRSRLVARDRRCRWSSPSRRSTSPTR